MPVKLLDFTSMYPTIGALMDLHRYHVARSLDVVDATAEVSELLGQIELDDLFDQRLWPSLVGFALIAPQGDILPARAAYDGKTWGIGVNPVFSSEPLWYSIADCVASKLLTGRSPVVLRAFRLTAAGRAPGLRTVSLRGTVEIDPRNEDPFKKMVEERQRVKRSTNLSKEERLRLSLALKIVANAGSYGIWSEFNRDELAKGKRERVSVHGRKEEPFEDRIAAPEDPGRYCFPALASTITGGARLMLALLERCVTDLGGTWAFCDTDSMAIVASEIGGLIPCPGGPERLQDGREGVRALSFAQVEEIRRRFEQLNPYAREAVPGSILKDELAALCFAISAKRYAPFRLDERGEPVLLDKYPPSEHGLGQFLNPRDPDDDDHRWVRQMWDVILRRELGLAVSPPPWFERPTMIRTTVTSPAVHRAFKKLNEGKTFRAQVKPFNFMMTAAGVTPPATIGRNEPFRLVAPWELFRTRSPGHSD